VATAATNGNVGSDYFIGAIQAPAPAQRGDLGN